MKYFVYIFATMFLAIDAKASDVKKIEFANCFFADLISKENYNDPLHTNNSASPLEVCFSIGGEYRRLRLYDNNELLVEIIEEPPIHARQRMFRCDNYFILSDGSDAMNILGHYFDNAIYRISDGIKMTSFSSEDLLYPDCSIIAPEFK